jgi:hypothetical protein
MAVKEEQEGMFASMKMLLDKRFLHFVPLVVSRGFSSACLGGIFVPFWVSVQQNLSDLTEKQKEA